MAGVLHYNSWGFMIGGAAMTEAQVPELQEEPIVEQQSARAVRGGGGVKFGKNNEFQAEVKRRVDAFFLSTGRPRRDVPRMYLKTAILLGAFVTFYVLLVFFARTWWQAAPLAILLGLTTAGIGFNIQHDGGHQAYSEHAWVNKLMALTLDMIGGSSYFWHYQHGVYHHTYVNITHEDTDIDLGMLARLSPHHRRYWFHRWQHLYIWPLYGLFVIKWHLFDDFKNLIIGRLGNHPIPRPKGWDLVAFIVGKVVFLTLALGIPLLFHRLWVVFPFYGIAAAVLGSVLSVVFQLAHAVEGAEFPMPLESTGNMEHAWAIHQVETTVDFARGSRVAAWLLGGLNFQIEHHLLPRICHVNFPALAPIVEETCREYGIEYNQHPSMRAGMASHFRWLRRMGRPL
jgi:linoleoyl-CoA desaturase